MLKLKCSSPPSLSVPSHSSDSYFYFVSSIAHAESKPTHTALSGSKGPTLLLLYIILKSLIILQNGDNNLASRLRLLLRISQVLKLNRKTQYGAIEVTVRLVLMCREGSLRLFEAPR